MTKQIRYCFFLRFSTINSFFYRPFKYQNRLFFHIISNNCVIIRNVTHFAEIDRTPKKIKSYWKITFCISFDQIFSMHLKIWKAPKNINLPIQKMVMSCKLFCFSYTFMFFKGEKITLATQSFKKKKYERKKTIKTRKNQNYMFTCGA